MDGHVSRLCVGQPHSFAADSVDQLATLSQRWVLSHLVFGLFCDSHPKSHKDAIEVSQLTTCCHLRVLMVGDGLGKHMKHFVRCSAAVLDIMDVLPGSGIWPCPSVLQDRWHSFSCFVGHENSTCFTHFGVSYILFFWRWSF